MSSVIFNGATREIKQIGLLLDGVPRLVAEGWAQVAGVERQWFGGDAGGGTQSLVATASPTDVSGAVGSGTTAYVQTNQTTASATGGTAPYTYEWSAGTSMTPTSPNSAATAFFANVGPADGASDSFTCTVTDSIGLTAVSNIVTANVYNYGSGA